MQKPHLLCSNDWMNAHHCDEDIKVQRFCLTLLGEARLWYHSLEPLGNTTWAQLQNFFRTKVIQNWVIHMNNYFKHGDHSFLMKNTETIDSYVIRIRQVTTPLGYGEPQILEVFKEHITNKTILDSVPYRRSQTSSRDGKENID